MALGDHNFADFLEHAVKEIAEYLTPARPIKSETGSLEAEINEDSTSVESDSEPSSPHSHISSSQSDSGESDGGSDSPPPSSAPLYPLPPAGAEQLLSPSANHVIRKRSSAYLNRTSDESDHTGEEKNEKRAKPGTSRSAVASRNLREEARLGIHTPNYAKYDAWRQNIQDVDARVVFRSKGSKWDARCSRCGIWVKPKEPGYSTRFRGHYQKCSEKNKSTYIPALDSFLVKKGGAAQRGSKNPAPPIVPCPGLTGRNNKDIPTYLKRTMAVGGGGRALHVIAVERFNGQMFSELDEVKKQQVLEIGICRTLKEFGKGRRGRGGKEERRRAQDDGGSSRPAESAFTSKGRVEKGLVRALRAFRAFRKKNFLGGGA